MRTAGSLVRRLRDSGLALPVGLLLAAAIIWQASYSSFATGTSNPGNSWGTGTLALTATDGAGGSLTSTPVMTETDWWPDATSTITRCITVTYAGTLTPSGPARIYASSPTTSVAQNGHTLSSYLELVVEESTTLAADVTCSGFAAGTVTTLFDSTTNSGPTINGSVIAGSMMDFYTNNTDYTSGITTGWTPSPGDTAKSFRFTVSFPGSASFPGTGDDGIDSDLIGMSATNAFTWEIQK